MDLKYDMKFEEMKKYIPFLESMIQRLDTTSSGSVNPRQAQLDKIRSLRDLLMVKKKRMKMDNLLKCEQVLINLYTKVEQRDTLPGIESASKVISPKDKSDLNLARTKLKSVVTKPDDPDTLPEIARASEAEVICVPGSKEPALFQRRPNKGSISPSNSSANEKSPSKSNSKRNYTRVLVSPDRKNKRWSQSDERAGNPLFSRRSPPRPTRRYSPTYHKRERRKSSKQEIQPRKSKDFNITLKVPEERLDSLNTKDILTRIINCSDGDVDIATLRELRTQILGELKQTGTSEDISDLILRSYKNKQTKGKKDDVEEGELSDSESEAIESIYGNLVVVEKDSGKAAAKQHKTSRHDQEPRKIQICLVINSDKDDNVSKPPCESVIEKQKVCEITDFEMFDDNVVNLSTLPLASGNQLEGTDSTTKMKPTSPIKTKNTSSQDIISIDDVDSGKEENFSNDRGSEVIDMNNFDLQDNSSNLVYDDDAETASSSDPIAFKANFYKPLNDLVGAADDFNNDKALNKPVSSPTSFVKSVDTSINLDTSASNPTDQEEPPNKTEVGKAPIFNNSESNISDMSNIVVPNAEGTSKELKESTVLKVVDKAPEIPLLNEPSETTPKKVVSEIDILQALKNDILSETIALPCAEITTPAMHQPKVTKVSNIFPELPKKRISIEKYKQKTVAPSKQSLFVKQDSSSLSKEDSRKQSLKLTEKEVERFNLISKIALGESSDDENDDEKIRSPEDIDLAPKSPDVEVIYNDIISSPVIIPADPVKPAVVSSKVDVDMRKLLVKSSTAISPLAATPNISESKNSSVDQNIPGKAATKWTALPLDPRVRRDKDNLTTTPLMTFPNVNSSRTPNNCGITPNMTPNPNITPNMTPNRTPSRAPNMTPNTRPFEVTPNRPFDIDDSSRKHVYAPMYPTQDVPRTPVWEGPESSPIHKPNREASIHDREQNSNRKWDDRDPRNNYIHRDDGQRPRYGDSHDNSYNRPKNDRFNREDFNRQDSPKTPNFYSRSDCPVTPTPSFGRGDAPATPSHYFGRSDCPMTPSHPFGRSDGPSTPSHPFGRSEAPMTPSHPFGRSDYPYVNTTSKYAKPHDPRFIRQFDNDKNNMGERGTFNDRYRYNKNDPRNYNNERARHDGIPCNPDQNYNREQMSRREQSAGHSMAKDYERDRFYSRERNHGPDNARNFVEMGSRHGFQREQSVGRSIPDHRIRASSVGRNSVNNELSVKSHAGRAFTIDTSVNSTFQKFIDSHRNNASTDSFDARRQRASSVGRSLTRESSVGRTLSSSSSYNNERDNRNRFQRAQSVGRDFSRAQSVGRDLQPRMEKSFKDVKAEFESYNLKYKKSTQGNTVPSTKTYGSISSRDPRRRDSYDKQHERTSSFHKSNIKESTIPVKKFNHRDPRQRKDDKMNERSLSHTSKSRPDSRDRHSYGISSESVTKSPATNLVKNYKIPKIKRASEEKPVLDVAPVTVEAKKKETKPVNKDVKQKTSEKQMKSDKKAKTPKKTGDKISIKEVHIEKSKITEEKIKKRVTRQSGKKSELNETLNQSDDEEVVVKTRRFKKVIYDSDSDENTSEILPKSQTGKKKVTLVPKQNKPSPKRTVNANKMNNEDTVLERDNKNQSPLPIKIVKESENPSEVTKVLDQNNKSAINSTVSDIQCNEDKVLEENRTKEHLMQPDEEEKLEEKQDGLDSSFGLDEIDLFPDNIITDPVLDNINALIADLDSDLEAPKGDTTCNDMFSEISIENMLEKITSSPIKPYTKKDSMENSKPDIDVVKNNLFDSLKQSETSDLPARMPIIDADNKTTPSEVGIVAEAEVTIRHQLDLLSQADKAIDSEAVVSTSVDEEDTAQKDLPHESDKNIEGLSAPDSTNDADIVTQETCSSKKPSDSATEKQSEMNSDISSTHDTSEKSVKDSPEVQKEAAPQIDSIGSILSILQDKSKIKELLSMLGDQSSDNEKIKKKLEKLSEIVSDDDDTNDGITEKTDTLTDEIGGINARKQEAIPDNQSKIDMKVNASPECEAKSINEKDLSENKEDNKPKRLDHQEEPKDADEDLSKNKKDEISKPLDQQEKPKNADEDLSEDKEDEISKQLDQQEEPKDADDVATSEPDNDKDPELFIKKMAKKPVKRSGKFRRGRGGKFKRTFGEDKRMTRSEASVLQGKPGPAKKKPSRELKQLQESIKEMFMSDAILNASGIRMCRLAKMVDESPHQKEDVSTNESEPIVVLEKVKHINEKEAIVPDKPPRKKPGPKPKVKPALIHTDEIKAKNDIKPLIKYKPGPKSKTQHLTQSKIIQNDDMDPYNFETDSLNETKESEKTLENSSDSENESLASYRSFGSSDLLVESKKKPKRKRRGWQAGVIKPKNKKRKVELKRTETPSREPSPEPERKITIPDLNCFTDKIYCFSKNVSNYPCRLCESSHSSADIVFHYRKHHPHSEIPLSRMSPAVAKEAIEQCEEINFQAISKIPTEKYTCRFCYKEFAKRRASLETFFWHVVSMHTGEYKQLCSECINVTRCPFNLDIPPPPKDVKGQLIGYICGKCNFTQVSLENLKMHVIVRHNDEQTEVYTINFAVMTKKTINSLVKRCGVDNLPRVTRSSRSNQSLTEPSDDRSDITESDAEKSDLPPHAENPRKNSFKSKIIFETDDNASDVSNIANNEGSIVKTEREEEDEDANFDEPFSVAPGANNDENESTEVSDKSQGASDDIMDYPHFKIRYTATGSKEYVCCINGTENHYKTGLLISMKKHVQLKHSEIWDGYCFVCKVIVTSQGQHKFTECLLHFLDNHIDSFPILEDVTDHQTKAVKQSAETNDPLVRASTPKTYLNRPCSGLQGHLTETSPEPAAILPQIEKVVSLIPSFVEPLRPSPTYPVIREEDVPPKEYNYEEAQAEIMSKKHRVVLDAMMVPDKLVQVFKCAGRFCSFTSDSAEDALMHASTHQRVGGTNALLCAYCDFDSSGNSIDLVSHVFKNHGRCQYACALCFYRAAANQLVGAHVSRVHGAAPGNGTVLRANNAQPISDSTEGNLNRDVAVPLYICKQTDREEPCTFKTVTHTKFYDHLTQRHVGATTFNCYMCSESCGEASALVVHMMTHGLKLYHCTRCVFGADGERELLAHASARHPGKPPQAYLRTIRDMGDKGLKILPLVELKKTVLPTVDVVSKTAKENPVREAERSIELEKLIGQINVLDAPEPRAEPEPEPLPAAADVMPELMNDINETLADIAASTAAPPSLPLRPVPPLVPITIVPERQVTPPPPVDLNLSKQVTPVFKEEPRDTSPEKTMSEVICLDSDEEDSKHGIISLSDDEIAANNEHNVLPETAPLTSTKKLPPTTVFKCGKCVMVCSTLHGFKKHLVACYNKTDTITCAHCNFTTRVLEEALEHYTKVHMVVPRFSCKICGRLEWFLTMMKKHVKTHGISKVVVTSKNMESSDVQYEVGGTPEPPARPAKPRRKPSAGPAPATPTKRRYGPADVHKLPINPILEESVHCGECEFHTKVRLNMVRHLQLHAEQQPAPETAPVNPVPHLETNEKHFDKMVNLASSSAATRPERPAREPAPAPGVAPELVSRYPGFVPDRQRHTCGARGCSYISLDEGMLRRHWEALHSGSTDYHCVHCPPYQHLDKSKPLTAARILAHLKMHDAHLYACSQCPYYHSRRQVVDKHAAELHRGAARALVVREPGSAPAPPAPTMDLKPWQCGLCRFRSMLRPEVVDHCAASHQSKMQFKCAYCPFRTSMQDNVIKHQAAAHPARPQEIFYFYYREGSLPDSADGTPFWQHQRKSAGPGCAAAVKAEAPGSAPGPLPARAPAPIDLNLVKQEVDPDSSPVLESIEDLCKKYSEFCEPNGLNYRCSLCKVVMEDSKEAMQSHLFEELKYRKWGCRLCSYKAFHQAGLKEHMWTEHRQNQEPIELPVDVNVEAWVSQQLDYQEDLIKKNREKLAQQRIQVERSFVPNSFKTVEVPSSSASKLTTQELEKLFGPLGSSSNMMFCCPKCPVQCKEEPAMQDHLEAELTRIRWCCSNCSQHFTTYHEAQFHCKSVHAGLLARPVEAARDPALRAAWVAASLALQRRGIARSPSPPGDEDNSLLVVRYEEDAAYPEDDTFRRKRPSAAAADSDDEGLVIDEPPKNASGRKTDCPYCEFKTKYVKIIGAHILRHYDLKPFSCPYCKFTGNKPAVLAHLAALHPSRPSFVAKTVRPTGPPTILDLSKHTKKVVPVKKVADDALVCLICEKVFTDVESKTHVHDDEVPKFAKKGEVVVKCCDCLLLFPDVVAMQEHKARAHPDSSINYAYYKLLHDSRNLVVCAYCNQRFSHLIDMKSHHNAVHSSLKLKYATSSYIPGTKRKADEAIACTPKRCARKSTTKLPTCQAIAKKSTTKLPFFVESDSDSEIEEEEYSYYGSTPTSWDQLSNVTTMMPFCNTILPFTLKKLSEFINIEPKVVVKDIKNSTL